MSVTIKKQQSAVPFIRSKIINDGAKRFENSIRILSLFYQDQNRKFHLGEIYCLGISRPTVHKILEDFVAEKVLKKYQSPENPHLKTYSLNPERPKLNYLVVKETLEILEFLDNDLHLFCQIFLAYASDKRHLRRLKSLLPVS